MGERVAWRLNTLAWQHQVVDWGYPAFYGQRVSAWLWEKGVTDPQAYTDLPQRLRRQLADTYEWPSPQLIHRRISQDGTEKFLWAMSEGGLVESVWIPKGTRATLCISSQIGCSLNCRFCATGQIGLERNLADYEIYLQYHAVRHGLGLPVTNIVFMGMGEPLLNFSAVMGAFDFLTARAGLSPKRITFSTVGIPKGIQRLATRCEPFELAISLHSAIEETRRKLIPLAERIALSDLREAIGAYCAQRKDWVTIEYVLLDGINDSPADAAALRAFVAPPIWAKVNLIVYNSVPGLPFQPSRRMKDFQRMLLSERLLTTVRQSRGADIAAACGQLARRDAPRPS